MHQSPSRRGRCGGYGLLASCRASLCKPRLCSGCWQARATRSLRPSQGPVTRRFQMRRWSIARQKASLHCSPVAISPGTRATSKLAGARSPLISTPRWKPKRACSHLSEGSSRCCGLKWSSPASHPAGEHVYTIAAQTDSDGLLYLTVGVVREPGGSLALDGYPALVGAPASTGAASPGNLREVEDAALVTVVRRAIRNYLADAESELDADLLAGAPVSLPAAPLNMQSLDSLTWAPSGHSVRCGRARPRQAWSPVHARLRTRRRLASRPLGDSGHPDESRQLALS